MPAPALHCLHFAARVAASCCRHSNWGQGGRVACSGHININTTQSPPHPLHQSQQQPEVIGVMFSSKQQPADNLDILTVSGAAPGPGAGPFFLQCS